MALSDEGNGGIPATMLVGPTSVGNAAMPYYPYPVYSGQQNGNNNGFGGDWAWVILLILLSNGGWGGMGGFGGGMMWPMMMGAGMGGFGLGYDFPWLLNGQQGINNNVSDGFRDAQLHDSVTSVRDGVSSLATQLCGCCGDIQMGIAGVNQGVSNAAMGIQNSLCSGFAGVNQNISNTAAQGEIAANGRHNALTGQLYSSEINALQRSFAEQTANQQGFNAVQGQLAQCCCDNRLDSCQTRNTIQAEGASSRYEAANNTRDIITNATSNTQAILDKLCQLELDGVKGQLAQAQRENAALQNAVNMSAMRESQTAQTAAILQGQTAEVDALYNRLSNCPVPSTPVYGRQPIFTCPNNGYNNGCGCGCGQ